MDSSTFYTILCVAQGAYFVATGVWPLLSIRTFEKVTGPKTDKWLVKTVGALVAVIGAVLLLAGFRSQPTWEILLLGGGNAVVLVAVDVNYVLRRRIPTIYLADAVVQLLLILAWCGAAVALSPLPAA